MIKARLSAFLADRSGSVIIYVALAMPVLVGGMGLGGEAGYRYHNQRLLQHAADFAAHAGAVRKYKGANDEEIGVAATNVAVSSGYNDTLGIIDVEPHYTWTNPDDSVEVILTETRPRLFSAIFSDEPVVIAARAVAAVTSEGQPACILALSKSADKAVTVTGNSTTELAGCSVASNSSSLTAFYQTGSGRLEADCVVAAGGADYTLSTHPDATSGVYVPECGDVLTKEPPVTDPYYWVMEPDTSKISCQTTYNQNNTKIKDETVKPVATWVHPDKTSLPVMRFCKGLDLQGVVHFEPGLYIIEGGTFTINNLAKVTGKNVTFYFTKGGAAKFNGGAQLNLSAPTSGPYSGILFFGGRSDPDAHIIQGNSSSTLSGAVYMPASKVTFTGNSTTASGCTQVIANTIELTGNSGLASECDTEGTEEILVGHLISVVE